MAYDMGPLKVKILLYVSQMLSFYIFRGVDTLNITYVSNYDVFVTSG